MICSKNLASYTYTEVTMPDSSITCLVKRTLGTCLNVNEWSDSSLFVSHGTIDGIEMHYESDGSKGIRAR